MERPRVELAKIDHKFVRRLNHCTTEPRVYPCFVDYLYRLLQAGEELSVCLSVRLSLWVCVSFLKHVITLFTSHRPAVSRPRDSHVVIITTSSVTDLIRLHLSRTVPPQTPSQTSSPTASLAGPAASISGARSWTQTISPARNE